MIPPSVRDSSLPQSFSRAAITNYVCRTACGAAVLLFMFREVAVRIVGRQFGIVNLIMTIAAVRVWSL
jgi:hypothetical protein